MSNSARRELARREMARRSLASFAAYVDPKQAKNYQAPHLALTARYLEAAESGELWRDVPGQGVPILIIEEPPRHWKSSIVNKFVAWFVGKRKSNQQPHQVILTSYGAELAETNSRTVQDTLLSSLYGNVFPGMALHPSRSAAKNWGFADEPITSVVAAGVGGALTGQGADCAVVDDPIKGPEDAYSVARRDSLWSWWTQVLRTRVNPGGFVVFLLTRWHEDDVVGRILKQAAGQPNGDRIVVLRLPALAETDEERVAAGELGLPVDAADPLGREPGEALWPERYSAEQLQATKELDEIAFNAMYQGRPGREGGYLIGRNNFRLLEVPPEVGRIRWCIGTDWAMTQAQVAGKKTDPDYTTAGLIGLWWPDEHNRRDVNYVLAAATRVRGTGPEVQRHVKQFALDSAERIGQKPPLVGAQDNIDKLIFDYLRGDPELLDWPIVSIERRMMKGDKVVKSHAWRSRALGGRFFMVSDSWWGRPWNKAFWLEAEQFPRGTHDDLIDMVSVGTHYLTGGFVQKQARSYSG